VGRRGGRVNHGRSAQQPWRRSVVRRGQPDQHGDRDARAGAGGPQARGRGRNDGRGGGFERHPASGRDSPRNMTRNSSRARARCGSDGLSNVLYTPTKMELIHGGRMAAALTLDGVNKRYGGFHAVRDLSFQVEKGAICGFLGPNGAGKTSTLRMILGLQPATSGRIEILGADDGRKVRDRIGFLPEERGLYKKMTPVDAIAFFGSLKGVPLGEGRRRAHELLDAQGLGGAKRKKMKELSKGMSQKVQLIASVVHRPEFVILDEPFSGLDPVNQQGLEQMIRGLAADGATVL